MSTDIIPTEFAQPGFGDLVRCIGTDPQGEVLSGREAHVVAFAVYFNGQVHELVARTAPNDDDGPLYEGDEADLRGRAAALYTHLGHRALEQVVAYNPHIVITRRVPGITLAQLPVDMVREISHEQFDALATAIIEACEQPFKLDAQGRENALYDGHAITLIDYSLSQGPGVAALEFRHIISRTMCLLMRNTLTVDGLVAWRDAAHRAMDIMGERFPEEYAAANESVRAKIAEAMRPNGRRR